MKPNTWTTSSFCEAGACVEVEWRRCDSGQCVEVGFRKASASAETECVEVASGGEVRVRDSKDAPGGYGQRVEVVFPVKGWLRLLEAVKAGEADLPAAFHPLAFTEDEETAFCRGVVAGEFDPDPS
jgi:hypothetical protein